MEIQFVFNEVFNEVCKGLEEVSDATEVFLELLHEILSSSWNCFMRF